jgi:hypothetical protein
MAAALDRIVKRCDHSVARGHRQKGIEPVAIRPRLMSSNKAGTKRAPVGAGTSDDSGLKAISAMVPVEVIAVYNLIAAPPAEPPELKFWITVIMIPITGLYIAFGTKDAKNPQIGWRQALIAPFAFACWASATQGPMLAAKFPGRWEDWMGSIAVALGTLLLPTLNGILRTLGVPQN